MPELTEEEQKSKQHHQQQQPNNNSAAAAAIMDMDLDFDNSWPFDQISFPAFSNPMSPLLPSSSDRPYSPLWAFSDADDDRLAAAATHAISAFAAAGAGLRLSDSPVLLACNSNSVAKGQKGKGDDRKASSPFLGWIPVENPDGYCLIKERMAQALRYFKESTEQHLLAQVWAPVKDGDRYVLTTSGQPFVLDPGSIGLHQYRMVSLRYMFCVDGETDGDLGLPGRVFRQKLPEWSPDVQYYSSKEYSRLDHALSHNVHGTLALPVFEPSGQSCVGVLELIMTSQKIHYAPEVDKVCKALEAVNLKSSKILNHPNIQICNEGRQNALAEILEILTVACETHKLPLAQTWVPCMHRNVLTYGGGLKKSCTSFDGSCNGQVCMSTTDVAFYVVEAHMWGFREACLEHHLQKGQGVAGRAFLSHNSCFCRDITEFCKTEYPLVHYARMFGLTSCFAICLRSSYTGDDDYILEFFLPPQITDSSEQNTLLASLLVTMKEHLRSLKVASGVDLQEEEGFVEIIQASMGARVNTSPECMDIPQCTKLSPHANVSPKEGQALQLDSPKHQLMVTLDAKDNSNTNTPADGRHTAASVPQTKVSKKPSQRKRGKAEKSISLDVLQQYFAGSLKDAAKSLGVCPTTMKRICRQHGISRWPSRKIKKVNHSLSRLKRVIESVQGTEGAFNLTSLSTSPLPAGVGSMSWPSDSKVCNQQNSPNYKPPKSHFVGIGSPTCKTPGIDEEGVAEDQLLGGRILNQEELRMQNGFSPEVGQVSDRSKTGSGSREQSVGTPTSHGSCQGSPGIDNAPAKDQSVSPVHNQYFESGGSPDLALKRIGELNLSAACSIPDALGGMLLEDAGSSKDLRSLCPAAADAIVDEQVPECSWTNLRCPDFPPSQTMGTYTPVMPHAMASQEVKNMTIKATYREDIIRFRISLSSGIAELREEVARRLKLDVGTFDIKYLDDDQEWVLIACDADLQECMDVSSSSGRNIIRLSVHDANANLGSSCESTGEL